LTFLLAKSAAGPDTGQYDKRMDVVFSLSDNPLVEQGTWSPPFVLRGVKYFFGSKLSKRSFRLSLKKALFCKQRKRYHSINTVLAPGSGTYTRVELSLPSGTRVLASQRDERFGAKPGLV